MENKKNCYNCAYRQEVTGSAHSQCHFNWAIANKKPPKANEHGIQSGWYSFPFNFDPTWQEEKCSGYSDKKDKLLFVEFSSLEKIFSILNK